MALSKVELLEYVKNNFSQKRDGENVLSIDCERIIFLLDNCEISIPKENRFFGRVDLSDLHWFIVEKRVKESRKKMEDLGLDAGEHTLAYTSGGDFGHTTAEWKTVIKLGFYGLRNRLISYAQQYKDGSPKANFYSLLISVYDAILRFMGRAADIAISMGKTEMGESLLSLTMREPKSLYEVMQTTILYYVLQHIIEGTNLRTLGRLDSLYYPYYIQEEKQTGRALIEDFYKEIDRLNAAANIPFAIGGTDVNGKSLVNELSYLLVDVYKSLETNNTKFHILCSDDTPTALLESAFDGVRKGKNSIVFMSDRRVIEALCNLNEEFEDAVDYHVVGCYECGGNGELTCSCNGRINIPKAVELALNNGKDMLTGEQLGNTVDTPLDTFNDFYAAFIAQIQGFALKAIMITDIYESDYPNIHSAPILTGTYTCALEKGGDLYCDYSAKYNNSSINAVGLATATDAIYTIKKLVYEDKILSLTSFVEILKSNWEGQEPLRMWIKNKIPKYGTGNAEVDSIAKDIVDKIADIINGRPNVKGGVYRLGTFSIDWRWAFGECTAASADGRKKGETLSQNTSASFGADTKGATGHLLSVSKIDSVRTPNGSIVDIDLHISAVEGKNGLNSLVSSLKTYFDLGGFAVHYNVLNGDILRKAKENPELYPNLQVRLCGWNVLFNSLSEREKNEFIARAEK